VEGGVVAPFCLVGPGVLNAKSCDSVRIYAARLSVNIIIVVPAMIYHSTFAGNTLPDILTQTRERSSNRVKYWENHNQAEYVTLSHLLKTKTF